MAKQRRPRETERSKYWRRVIREWEKSGMTQASFCQERELSLSSFSWWRSEFNKRDRNAQADVQPSNPRMNVESNGVPFVQVSELEIIPPGLSNDRIEIILASGHQIRVPQEFSSDTLLRVLKLLESVC